MSFRRLFIANRGEVAARIARTAEALGIVPVFGVSVADRDAPYTRGREKVVLGPTRAQESYLDPVRVVQAAVQTRCTALHPGWGFLSENPLLASLCASHGVTFIGPPAAAMVRMAKKIDAKQAMARAGLRVIPGSEGLLHSLAEAEAVAAKVGYPVLLKADRGGGGKGMRIAGEAAELQRAFTEAQGEGRAAFGDGSLYLEKLVQGGRHVEVQLLADRYGGVVHFGARDCSVQRNHQKLIEESPAPTLSAEERERVLQAAVRAAAQIGYVGAGTLEFLLDAEGKLRFMEMNTRLQVEHTVSEARSGFDLVEAQIRVAAGERLWFGQSDVRLHGHAIECRINAEDPHNGFLPSPGVLKRWVLPVDQVGIRIDTHVEQGYEVSPFYDSLLCKMIAHGDSREQALERMQVALGAVQCEGVATTIPLHLAVLKSDAFRDHAYGTGDIPGWED